MAACEQPLGLEHAPRVTVAPDGASATVEAPDPCRPAEARIAGARFAIGALDGEPDERPPTQVTVPSFCIARHETSVAAYQACVVAGACTPADADRARDCNAGDPARASHPINCIDWEQARRYCAHAGGRLPSEAEWELAARGPHGRTYPWGDAPPDARRLNSCGAECRRRHPGKNAEMYPGDDGFPKTAPAGSYPDGATPEGVLDLAGNVWEWTADAHVAYDGRIDDPLARELMRRKVVRGGGWFHHLPERVRAANRHSYPPGERNGHVGVRCVR